MGIQWRQKDIQRSPAVCVRQRNHSSSCPSTPWGLLLHVIVSFLAVFIALILWSYRGRDFGRFSWSEALIGEFDLSTAVFLSGLPELFAPPRRQSYHLSSNILIHSPTNTFIFVLSLGLRYLQIFLFHISSVCLSILATFTT
jgi:hypothetical protein